MNSRNFELDVLRGLSIALMIIVDAPPDVIYKTLTHAAWAGINLADTVFPAFVFAMGASVAFATARREPSAKKIFRRAVLLFVVGFLLNVLIYFQFETEHLRLFGVLQRLALTYFFGVVILTKLKSTAKIFSAAFLLLIISSAGFHIYAPSAPFSEVNNISQAADYIFPGVNHIYTSTQDPEGLYGTFASTASMLFGIVAGKFLMQNSRKKLFLCGAVLLICGYLWSFTDIIAKKIWTAPFALLNAGGDMILLAAFGVLFESVPVAKKIFHPLNSLGKNPLFFFVASNVAVIFLCTIKFFDMPIWYLIYSETFKGFISPEFGTAVFCVTWCLILIIFAEILNRRNIFVRV